MIRRLGEDDRARVVALLSAAPQHNLYMLGNLESNGFDQDFCEFFGDVVDGGVRGVVNRYMAGWTVYGLPDADWASLAQVVDSHAVVGERLQDNPGGVATFLPYLTRYVGGLIEEETLMELPVNGLVLPHVPDGFVARRATMADLPGLIALYADAGDMTRTPAAVERPLRDRRVWVALHDDVIVAAALTNAETSDAAMIGGVFTLPAWRGVGLSQAVCGHLCAELIAVERQPYLYWENPAAGQVYRKLGFREIGLWRSVRLERC